MTSRVVKEVNASMIDVLLPENFVFPRTFNGELITVFPYQYEGKNGILEVLDFNDRIARLITDGIYQFTVTSTNGISVGNSVYLNMTSYTLSFSGSGNLLYGYVYQVVSSTIISVKLFNGSGSGSTNITVPGIPFEITSENKPNTIVFRDQNGNFAATTINVNQLNTTVLNTDSLNSQTITSDNIVTNTITANTINGKASDADKLDGFDSSYFLNRANHNGFQLANTISNFDQAVRTNRIDQLAAPLQPLNLNNQTINNLANPINPLDATNKQYVDQQDAILNSGLRSYVDGKVAAVSGTIITGNNTTVNNNNGVTNVISGTVNAISGTVNNITNNFVTTGTAIAVNNVTQSNLTATSVTNPNTLVYRDSNGNFAGNTIVANNFIGALTGTATNADNLDGLDSAYFLNRTNHTGTQTANTISNFQETVRTNRLDQFQVPVTNLDIGNQRLINVLDPINPTDGVNKRYVDTVTSNILNGISGTLQDLVRSISGLGTTGVGSGTTIINNSTISGSTFLNPTIISGANTINNFATTTIISGINIINNSGINNINGFYSTNQINNYSGSETNIIGAENVNIYNSGIVNNFGETRNVINYSGGTTEISNFENSNLYNYADGTVNIYNSGITNNVTVTENNGTTNINNYALGSGTNNANVINNNSGGVVNIISGVAVTSGLVNLISGTVVRLDGVAQSSINATSQNLPNTLVYRDGNGNFAANVITANLFSGTATNADRLDGLDSTYFIDLINSRVSGLANGAGNTTILGNGFTLNGVPYSGQQVALISGTPLAQPSTVMIRDQFGNVSANIFSGTATNALTLSGYTANEFFSQIANSAGTKVLVSGTTIAGILYSGQQIPSVLSTPQNVFNTIVIRDQNGNFAANNITANNFIGNLSGIANTANYALNADRLDGFDSTYFLNRANHSGVQPASSISDFDANVINKRLDQFQPPITAINLNGQTITNVSNPTNASDIVNKAYVDAIAAGLNPKLSVDLATTGPITLSGLQTVDGVTSGDGKRILVQDQVDQSQNGIYISNSSGAWIRSTDTDSDAEITKAYTFVKDGTINKNYGFVMITPTPTLGTSPIVWTEYSKAGDFVFDSTQFINNNGQITLAPPMAGTALWLMFSVAGDTYTDDFGFLWLSVVRGLTIGRVGSGASYSNVKAQKLFLKLWGDAVSASTPLAMQRYQIVGGKGSTALNDWNANKRLFIPPIYGRSPMVAGFPDPYLTTNGLTGIGLLQTTGEENHSLTPSELTPHNHAITQNPHTHDFGPTPLIAPSQPGYHYEPRQDRAGFDVNATEPANVDITINNTGGGQPFNVIHPVFGITLLISLGEKA